MKICCLIALITLNSKIQAQADYTTYLHRMYICGHVTMVLDIDIEIWTLYNTRRMPPPGMGPINWAGKMKMNNKRPEMRWTIKVDLRTRCCTIQKLPEMTKKIIRTILIQHFPWPQIRTSTHLWPINLETIITLHNQVSW